MNTEDQSKEEELQFQKKIDRHYQNLLRCYKSIFLMQKQVSESIEKSDIDIPPHAEAHANANVEEIVNQVELLLDLVNDLKIKAILANNISLPTISNPPTTS